VVIPERSPVLPLGNPNAPIVSMFTSFARPGVKSIFAEVLMLLIVLPEYLIPPIFATVTFAPGID
jgi:hypothetical protein